MPGRGDRNPHSHPPARQPDSLARHRLQRRSANRVLALQTHGPDGSITSSTLFHDDLFGYSQEELVGKTLWDVLDDAAEAARLKTYFTSMLRTQHNAQPYIFRFDNSSTEYLDVQIDWRQERGAGGHDKDIISVISDISNSVQTSETLRRERDMAERYLNIVEVMILGLDLEGNITLINPKGAQILGYSAAQLVGENWFKKVLYDEDSDEVRQVFHKLISSGQLGELEYFENHVLTASGEKRLMAWHNSVLRDQEGRIKGCLSSGQDITEQRAAEQRLKSDEEKYRTLVDNLPQRVFMKDTDLKYISCNRQFADDLGMEIDDVIGKSDYDLFPREIADKLSAMDRQVIEADKTVNYIDTDHSPGQTRTVRKVKTAVHDDKGKVVGVLGILWDITEQVTIEEQLRLAYTVFKNTVEGVMITDPKSKLIAVNEAFKKITGYDEDEVLGQSPAILHSGEHDDAFYKKMWSHLNEYGYWQGELWNRRKAGEIYPEWITISEVKGKDDQVTHYIGMFLDISERKEQEAKLRFMAHHDSLTKLPNRTLFSMRVTQAIKRAKRNNQHLAVLFVDLDRFKVINDSLGHSVGDDVLKIIAQRLVSSVREEDTVTRLGGDEFAILIEQLNHVYDVEPVALKILEGLRKPIIAQDNEIIMGASIGISVFPEDASNEAELLSHSDSAMYRSKQDGRSIYQFYSQEMGVEAEQRFSLEKQLRRAIENDELKLYYQPQVDIKTNNMIGMEVLLRWQNPSQGLMYPATFIELAENSGLIGPIGEWVLRHSCLQHRQWTEQGLKPPKLSVNLSVKQVRYPDLLDGIHNILEESKIDPRQLKLEITESSLMQNIEDSLIRLNKIRALGIDLAIDDFGTGYSSLNYLRRLPITDVKIDKSFVQDIASGQDGETIIRTVIAMAKNLRLGVIAEGVETEQQLDFLRHNACDQYQGYHYMHPVDAEAFTEILEADVA